MAGERRSVSRSRHFPDGGFWFLPGIRAYSAGIAADEGHAIVRASLRDPVPWPVGIDLAASIVRSEFDRPPFAICGLELRSPTALSYGRFAAFNRSYVAKLGTAGIVSGSVTPTARTNVVPVGMSAGAPVVTAFSFTVPRVHAPADTSFVISGAAESTTLSWRTVVRARDTHHEARTKKTAFVIGLLTARLEALRLCPSRGQTVSVYSEWVPSTKALDMIMSLAGSSSSFIFCRSRPPVEAVEFEMDVRKPDSEILV